MTTAQFTQVEQLLKEVYAQIREECLAAGLDILSPEYDALLNKGRDKLLAEMGFTAEQYLTIKTKVDGFTQAEMLKGLEDTRSLIGRKIGEIVIPSKEEIVALAHEVALQYIKPPQIINQIVERTTIEKPQIVKETRVEKVVEEKAYNEKPLLDAINGFRKRLDALPAPADLKKLRAEYESFFRDNFSKNFEKNIDTLNMPDWRKLAMGLREDIDTKVTGVGTHKITVSPTEPLNPAVGDLWVDSS